MQERWSWGSCSPNLCFTPSFYDMRPKICYLPPHKKFPRLPSSRQCRPPRSRQFNAYETRAYSSIDPLNCHTWCLIMTVISSTTKENRLETCCHLLHGYSLVIFWYIWTVYAISPAYIACRGQLTTDNCSNWFSIENCKIISHLAKKMVQLLWSV